MSQLMQGMGGMRGMASTAGMGADMAGQPEIGLPLQLLSMFLPGGKQQQPGAMAPPPARQAPPAPGMPQLQTGPQGMGMGGMASLAGGMGGLPPQLMQLLSGLMGGGMR